jgi:preprotein translocase subunit SecF
MSRLGNIGGRLYRGDVSIDFVGRKKIWFAISGLILVVSVAAWVFNGLNFSVDFKGGSVFQFQTPSATQSQIASVVENAGGGNDPIVQQLVNLSGHGASKWQVQTTRLSYNTTVKIQDALATSFHVPGGSGNVSTQFIGPSWGTQISDKAFQALIAFLIVIVIYLSIAFEWKMAVAAFVALAHDIVITTGVYALAHFQVSPATVIGLLTILGYSLYDTVVVFDKVRENTAGLLGTSKSTYSQAANLALNQTLVRSINTSLIALLPVTAILLCGWIVLGTGELPDLGLVLFVGMLSGTYSSIFIATPVVAMLKERERPYRELARRIARREAGGRTAQRAQAKAEKAQKATAVAGRASGASATRGLGTGTGTLDDDSGTLDQGPVRTRRLGASTGPGAPAAAGSPPEDVDEEPDRASAEDDVDSDAGPDERVPAARAAAGGSAPKGASGARPGPRQQPRRAGPAKRRPAGKKKRR